MDGRQATINRSIQSDLSRGVMLATLLFALIAGGVSGLLAFHEARELQDDMLHDISALVITGQLYSTPPVTMGVDTHNEHGENRIIIQRIDRSDNQILASLADFGDGLQTLDVKDEGWRVLIKTVPTTKQQTSWRFAVAQQTEERDEIAWQNGLSAFLPVLVLAAVMLVLVNVVIRNRFKPLRSLVTLIEQHDETRLEPLPDNNIPEEMVPFLRSINQLLARVRRVLTQQQRFIANAAHELRTPVTALSLLAENLKNATTEEDRSQRQAQLQEGLTRLRILVGQLLNFARLQSEHEPPLESIVFNGIVQQSIADLYPLAEEKGIDLGISRQETITVLDFSHSLSQLVTNAIDNAIRYTPPGGKIDISLFSRSGNAVLLVQDSGPGIPENELLEVLTAFYRTQGNQEPGTGLGLSISLEIARVLGGEITLSNRESGGLQFQYIQPLAAD